MPEISICEQCGDAHWADRPHGCGTEHDRLEAQYNDAKARQKVKDHADAFMEGWSRAKLHSSTLEDAFEAWRVCLKPGVPNCDVMLRKLRQIRKLALSAEGHAYDLFIALADEALAAARAGK